MSLKSQIEEMPGEKQVAWGVRLFMSVAILIFGVLFTRGMDKLDKIADTQAAQTEIQAVQSTQLNRLILDDSRRVSRIDELRDLYYLLRDRIAALELRLDQRDKRDVPPER